MLASVILTCTLGEDISDWKIDFWEGGKSTKKDTLYCLRWTFNQLSLRCVYPHCILFPSLANWFILPSDRDSLANVRAVRNAIREIIRMRRNKPTNGSDLLSLLLKDPLFADEEILIDEMLTVFFAGSQTTAISTSNLLF